MPSYTNSLRMPPDGTGKHVRMGYTVEVEYKALVIGKSFAIGDHISFATSGVHGNVMAVSTMGTDAGFFVLRLHNAFQTPIAPVVDEAIRDYTGATAATVASTRQTYNNITQLVGGNNPTYTQSVDAYGAAYTRFAEGAPLFDGTGLQQASTFIPLGNYDYESDDLSVELVGAATQTENHEQHRKTIIVSSANGDEAHLETNKWHHATPGVTSVYSELTIQLGDTGKTGNIRRWGYFSDDDGVFFELNGTALSVVLRSHASGTPVDTKVAQSSWNHDTVNLSANSLSRMKLDVSYVNKYWFEITTTFGVGTARLGVFNNDGSRIVVHEFNGYNTSSQAWIANANLPLHVENVNVAATASSSEISFFHGSVLQNGFASKVVGKTFETCMDFPQTNTNTATWSHLVSLKPAVIDGHGHTNRAVVIPRNISVSSVDANDLATHRRVKVEVWRGTTITGGSTWTKNKGHSIADISNATTWTGGTAITEWVISGNQIIDLSEWFSYLQNAAYNDHDGNETVITFGVKSLDQGVNVSCIAALVWEVVSH